MPVFNKKDIIEIDYPFADSRTATKKRPALILANINHFNYIVMQISKERLSEPNRVIIFPSDCVQTHPSIKPIRIKSGINCEMITTVNKEFIKNKLGYLNDTKYNEVVETFHLLIQ